MAQDPEQTESMCSVEHKLWSEAAIVLIDLWKQYGEGNWDSSMPPYLMFIQARLAEEVTAAHMAINNRDRLVNLHLHRRVIAFYHQEFHLRNQGQAAWNSAVEDGALTRIMYGCA